MGFSAMLAEEYILIVPFAYQLQFGLNEQSPATEYNINCINFTQLQFGLTNHGISAQQKALAVGSNSMTDTLIIEKAIEEIETKTFGVTESFLEIHKIVYVNNKPKVARIDTDRKDLAVVYFNVEDEKFFLAIYIDLAPTVSVRAIHTEPYHSVYFRASSDKLSLTELSELTRLTSTCGRNKGDKKNPNTEIVWKESTIFFEPNPEADEFEDKLTKLLDYLGQDKDGVEKLVNNAGGYIQVYSSFHNGNTWIGGHHIDKDHIKRMSKLNLEIDFDISADGNFFT